MNGTSDAPTTGELFSIVSHPVRRWLLKRLSAETATPIDTLAQEGVECGVVAPGTHPRNLELSLHHTHLPRLETAGFVTVDDDARDVRLSPSAKTILDPAVVELDAVVRKLDGDPGENTRRE